MYIIIYTIMEQNLIWIKCLLIVKAFPLDISLVSEVKTHLARDGLMTAFDIKNFFNNIPVDIIDQVFCTSDTPLRRFKHTCLDFGHLNRLAIWQSINTQIALEILYTLRLMMELQNI